MAKLADIPKEIADDWENIVEAFHGRLVEQRKQFKQRTGTKPFKGEEVSQEQKMIQVSQMEQSDWEQVFQKHGIIKEDGRLLLPNEMLQQTREVQKVLKRGEFNF